MVKHSIFKVVRMNYHGPCPADRENLYQFKLYAQDSELALPENATKRQVKEAMAGKILVEDELQVGIIMKLASQI